MGISALNLNLGTKSNNLSGIWASHTQNPTKIKGFDSKALNTNPIPEYNVPVVQSETLANELDLLA